MLNSILLKSLWLHHPPHWLHHYDVLSTYIGRRFPSNPYHPYIYEEGMLRFLLQSEETEAQTACRVY